MIGLLGGVASGKSTVAGILHREGAWVLDADALAREALEEPAVVLELTQRFGSGILNRGGAIDAKKLADMVFQPAGSARRQELEGVVHPRVLARIEQALGAAARARPCPPMVVLDVPLLLGSPLETRVDLLVFVDTPQDRREALGARGRGWTKEEIAAREAAQPSLDVKRSRAQHILTNDGELQGLIQQTRQLFAILMRSRLS